LWNCPLLSCHTTNVIPGMNAIAFTREVRALARLEGWIACARRRILRGSPKWLAPQDDAEIVEVPRSAR
jgi:hypothetical protein